MFRDECEIEVAAGRGGDGLVSFRREKYVHKGGPDGGDGGDGGSVILEVDPSINSLLSLGRRPTYRAKNGQPGGPRNRSGARGADLVLQVPRGTQVFDAERGQLLKDLVEPDARLVLAAGGKGGNGNTHFATSIVQAPRRAETGRDGEQRRVRLELKLFAEVGLVGLPNAGKSTFLSSTSRARPKVADYPFTTLVPHVGIVPVGEYDTIVVADLPGLIEGASAGQGLGIQFLKHVERCRVLLHFVDLSDADVERAAQDWAVIDRELEQYSAELYTRPRLAVATKVEDDAARAAVAELARVLGREVLPLSSHTREGLPELLSRAKTLVRSQE